MPFDSTSIYGLRVNYLFNEHPLSYFGPSLERRIKSSSKLVEGFVSDQSGEYDLLNLFDSSSQNSIMIDKLVDYRLGNSVSLDDIDATGLTYTLSRLIYTYLNLMVNNEYTELDTANEISSDYSAIDNLFELYVLNESHKLMKTWKNITDSDVEELRPIRRKYVIDTSSLTEGLIIINEDKPYLPANLFLYKNGELQPDTNYSYTTDSTSVSIAIDSTGSSGLNLIVGDIIVLDSFVKINPVDPTEILEE
jgi:hypothetical protein